MFEFNINKWVPKFILQDKNGYALAKAIEAGLQKMNDTIGTGVDLISEYDTMPEWRLDELAWEYNIFYDFSIDIDTKRRWIRDAVQSYSIYGTAEIIKRYLTAIFYSATVEENWEYEGDPYHFRIIITGQDNTGSAEIVQKTVEKIKNTRSVLDGIIYRSGESDALVNVGTAIASMEIVVTSNTLEED